MPTNPYEPPQSKPERSPLRHFLSRIGFLLLHLFLALVGWLVGIYCAMLIGLSQYDNYMHYTEGPIGVGFGIAGVLVAMSIPSLLRTLSNWNR